MSDQYASPFSDETTTRAEWGTAKIEDADGVIWAFPILDDIDETQLARWAPKQTSGDTSLDSDDLISAQVLSNRRGGGQVARHSGASQQRYWDATGIDTRFADMISLLPAFEQISGPNAVRALPLGDYPQRGAFYAVFDTLLCAWDPNTATFTTIDDITEQPVNKAVEYAGKLWIPLGANGIASFNSGTGTVTLNTPTTVNAVSLCLWDDKLFALTTTGQLVFYNGTSWTAPAAALTLPTSRRPRQLEVFHDPSDNPALFVLTDEDLWVYDALIPKLYRTGCRWTPDIDHGLAMATFQNTELLIGVGIDTADFNGSVRSLVGLARNDGVPAELRGAVVDMHEETNGMLVLVRGAATDNPDDDIALEETQIYDDPPIIPQRQTVSSLWNYDGTGWTKMWQSAGAGGDPTRVLVSSAGGAHEVWWGYNGEMLRMRFPKPWHNPEQAVRSGSITFQPNGRIVSGKYDHAMPAFWKLASHAVVTPLEDHRGSYELWYHTDHTDWAPLGTVTDGSDIAIFPFDPDGDGFAEGQYYRWIEFEERMTQATTLAPDDKYSDPAKTTPLIWNTVLKYIKLPKKTTSFVLTVPLDFPESWEGRGPDEIASFLLSLPSDQSARFHRLIIGDREFRVRVAQAQRRKHSGANYSSMLKLNLLEVPLS